MSAKLVLLAEDDPNHRELFLRAVEESGVSCKVDVVEDGAETIDYLFASGRYRQRDSQDMPDLILLDLRMPKMDGLQVLQILRRVRSDDHRGFPPVVVLTSSHMDDDISEAYRLGAQSYICKPLEYAEFCKAVCETLRYWLNLNRPMPIRRPGLYAVHERM